MKFPSLPRKGRKVEDDVTDIINYLRASRVINVVGGKLKMSPNGTTIDIKPGKSTTGNRASSEVCPFGRIVTIPSGETTVPAILGGVVHCGDQNWYFEPQEINTATDGSWIVYFSVALSVNQDDDSEILLPGVITGTKPTVWSKTATPADYPDNTDPVAGVGTGTVILPIGVLTIVDAVPSFAPSGCGNFFVTHCAGSLSYTRG